MHTKFGVPASSKLAHHNNYRVCTAHHFLVCTAHLNWCAMHTTLVCYALYIWCVQHTSGLYCNALFRPIYCINM